MPNVYEKMQNARVMLKNEKMTPSGLNKFAGYKYFELGDFLPSIINICNELKLCTNIKFTNDLATLVIINSEKPEEQIEFTSPMSKASLKGCHEVQNLGAVQTYIRRYLYTNAFDITEHDALDSTQGAIDKQISKQTGDNLLAAFNHDYIKQALTEWGLNRLGELKESQLKAFELKIKDIQRMREVK